jgi:hypothetical protein
VKDVLLSRIGPKFTVRKLDFRCAGTVRMRKNSVPYLAVFMVDTFQVSLLVGPWVPALYVILNEAPIWPFHFIENDTDVFWIRITTLRWPWMLRHIR